MVAGGPVGRTRSGLGGGCSRRSLALSDASESNLNATVGLAVSGRRLSYPSRVRVKSMSVLRTLPRQNSSIQFQVCDRLSFTGKYKFVIAASRPESLRSLVFGTSVSEVQIRYFLLFRVASFSRLRPDGPPSSRLVTAPGAVTPSGSVGPRP